MFNILLGYQGKSSHWFGDGTFDVSPTAFNQLFTLQDRYMETRQVIFLVRDKAVF